VHTLIHITKIGIDRALVYQKNKYLLHGTSHQHSDDATFMMFSIPMLNVPAYSHSLTEICARYVSFIVNVILKFVLKKIVKIIPPVCVTYSLHCYSVSTLD
jgi:hypothetical protein